MEVNKDIGDGIKHRLKDLQKAPDDMVWDKIETDLKKKKKKRILFFLLPISGLLLLTLLLFHFNTDHKGMLKNDASTPTEQTKNTSYKNSKNSINKIIRKNTVVTETANNIIHTTTTTTQNDNNNNNNNNNSISNNSSYSSSSSTNRSWSKNNMTKTSSKFNPSNINNNESASLLSLNQTKGAITNSDKKTLDLKSKLTHPSTTDSLKLKKTEDSIQNKLVLEKKDIVKKDSIKDPEPKRWSVMPYTSLDYFGSLNHATKNNTSTNYGVKINYLATKDISIRVGFAKLDLNFKSDEDNFDFSQKISYFEIPLEVKQKLINGKVNTSILAGVSYLLLEKAKLYTNGITNNLQIETIENSNMSVNLGLSFDTLIIKKLHFVVEPIFKYHFKPLENRLDSKTFTLSVLGGLEYKF